MNSRQAFSHRFLEEQKNLLLKLKQDILNKLNTTVEAMGSSQDQLVEEVDQAQAHLEQNLCFELKERDTLRLKEINYALSKFELGTYGICEETDEPINEERLRKMPWTRLSIEAAEQIERFQGRFKRVN